MTSQARGGQLALVLLLLTGAACSPPTDPEPRLWQLDFFALRFDSIADAHRRCRMVNVLLDERPPIEPRWESSVSMNISRSVGDTRVTAWEDNAPTVHFRLERLNESRVRLVVSGPYEVTVEGFDGGSSGYLGDWECGPDFPFADAPAFSDAGLDATVPVPGSWTLGPLPLHD